MEFPHLNMNGTSKDELISQYTGAIAAMNIAIDMLQLTNPHGRDYPNPIRSLSNAVEQHAARIKAICAVRDTLQLIAEYVDAQSRGERE
jgi:hypothetical protein